MSQQEYFGNDSIQNLAGIIAKEKPESIFLVTGMDSYAISGAEGAINSMLSNYPGNVGRFYQFETNPKLEDAERGFKDGLITTKQYNFIKQALDRKECPPWNTSLGGVIGIRSSLGSNVKSILSRRSVSGGGTVGNI